MIGKNTDVMTVLEYSAYCPTRVASFRQNFL